METEGKTKQRKTIAEYTEDDLIREMHFIKKTIDTGKLNGVGKTLSREEYMNAKDIFSALETEAHKRLLGLKEWRRK